MRWWFWISFNWSISFRFISCDFISSTIWYLISLILRQRLGPLADIGDSMTPYDLGPVETLLVRQMCLVCMVGVCNRGFTWVPLCFFWIATCSNYYIISKFIDLHESLAHFERGFHHGPPGPLWIRICLIHIPLRCQVESPRGVATKEALIISITSVAAVTVT